MSRLLILGNTNKFTFCNAIVAAQYKSKKYLNEQISDIYVIHSKESFHKLFNVSSIKKDKKCNKIFDALQ